MKKILLIMVMSIITFSCSITEEIDSDVNLNAPGEYSVDKGYVVSLPYNNATVNTTIKSITVNNDLSLGINMIWTVYVDQGYSVTKYSDANNYDINLTDNFGNTYFMTDAKDAAGVDVTMTNGDSCFGTFVFPQPTNGIIELSFNDDDNNISITINVVK